MISRAITNWNGSSPEEAIEDVVLHTGQHHDAAMSAVFFEELDITPPAVNLGIAGGRHGEMTGRMLEGIEGVLLEQQPDWVLVHGDTNSTLAGALAAAKLHIPIAHVESGLRSHNRRMPEEVNRIVTDAVADVLFVPTRTAEQNLLQEGVSPDRIRLTGDVMYDAALHYGAAVDANALLAAHQLVRGGFILATVHRAENTDDRSRLLGLVEGLQRLAVHHPLVLPLHPRTRAAMEREGVLDQVERGMHVIPPVGYLDMLALEKAALLVATDSGGVQKEAYFAGTPCLTLRDETEWVELLEIGANVLCGADPDAIEAGAARMTHIDVQPGLYGDGRSGELILGHLLQLANPRSTHAC